MLFAAGLEYSTLIIDTENRPCRAAGAEFGSFYEKREAGGRCEIVVLEKREYRSRFVVGLAYTAADQGGHSYKLVVAVIDELLPTGVHRYALFGGADRYQVQFEQAERRDSQAVILEDRFIRELERHHKLKQQIKRDITRKMLPSL